MVYLGQKTTATLNQESMIRDVQETQSMNKIHVVIADDEPLARQGIRQLLAKQPDFAVIAETRNGRETVRALRELKPELLFLDVQMPILDGFDVLRQIGPEKMPVVIFVTAYDEFAVKAFEAQALDYLVKPLEEVRFAHAIERVRKSLRSAKAVELSTRLTAILASRKEERTKQKVFVPTSSGDNLVLDVDEIQWIEADNYYAAIHARGRRHLLRESLASLEQRLDGSQFVRAHRSAIVNIDRVRKLRKEAGETFLVLNDGVGVPVSRRRREQVLRLLRRPRP
jgi:two-component system, LytTR family, response regulator